MTRRSPRRWLHREFITPARLNNVEDGLIAIQNGSNPTTGDLDYTKQVRTDTDRASVYDGGSPLWKPFRSFSDETWTPTFNNISDTGGTATGTWRYVGRNWIWFEAQYTIGSASPTLTAPSLDWPVAATDTPEVSHVHLWYYDSSGADRVNGVMENNPTTSATGTFRANQMTGATIDGSARVTALVPWSWTINDRIAVCGFYSLHD